jgi:peptidylprolyl isomerase
VRFASDTGKTRLVTSYTVDLKPRGRIPGPVLCEASAWPLRYRQEPPVPGSQQEEREMTRTTIGDHVKIHYTGRFEDGTVFDSSTGKPPIAFEVGSQSILPAINDAVVGMTEGESKTIRVTPQQGFGERRPELEQEVARSQLPDQVAVGDVLQARTDGEQILVRVKELGQERAVVDANHPLAGQTVEFEIELVELQQGSPPTAQDAGDRAT